MPVPYERHLFVCTNRREDGHPRGCCAARGAEEVRDAFKAAVAKRGLRGRVRAQQSGCLDVCEWGVTVVVYPEAVWYRGVTVADVDEIVDEHLVAGRPVDRLLGRD
ncbi:MAG: (2Fe-2S) ferredoxin domain-containing protein [Planctomycetota bacterium]